MDRFTYDLLMGQGTIFDDHYSPTLYIL